MYLSKLELKKIPFMDGLKVEGIIVTMGRNGVPTSVTIGKAHVKNDTFVAIGYGGFNTGANIADYVKNQKQPSKFKEPGHYIEDVAVVITKDWKQRLIKELI